MTSFGRVSGWNLVTLLASSIETELWLATDEDEDEIGVIKRPRADAPPSASARIRAEGSAVEALKHPGVIQLLSQGEAEGLPYLVLEYLAGEDALSLLRQAQATGTGIPLAMAARIVADAADGVNALHERKRLIHGDLAPANLFTEYGGRSLVLDLGASRPEGNVSSTLAGRRAYLAPEALRGAPAHPRMDVFSLGATLCELFSGSKLEEFQESLSRERSPTAMQAGAWGEKLRLIPAASLEAHFKALAGGPLSKGSDLAKIVARAIHPDPGERFHSTSELARALEPLAAPAPSLAEWMEGVVPAKRREARCDPLPR